MKLSTVSQRMKNWYLARVCVYLISAPGRGKTTVICEGVPRIGKELGLNLGLVVINGAALTISDATGYLIPKDRNGMAISVFTRPFWWMTAEGLPLEAYDGGVIFIDEADKMGIDEKKIIGEATLSGRLASHNLPKGWVVWMAGNDSTHRSGSTRELDHLISRRMELQVTDDLPSTIAWMKDHGSSAEAIRFTEENSTLVFTKGVPEKQGPWCTPRALVQADDYLRAITPEGEHLPTDADTLEELQGKLGSAAAAQFMAMIKLGHELPTIASILADPMKVKVPSKPDAQMLMVFKLAAYVDKENCGPIIDYVGRLPKDFEVIFAKSALDRKDNIALLYAKPFMDWCGRNNELVTVVSRLK